MKKITCHLLHYCFCNFIVPIIFATNNNARSESRCDRFSNHWHFNGNGEIFTACRQRTRSVGQARTLWMERSGIWKR